MYVIRVTLTGKCGIIQNVMSSARPGSSQLPKKFRQKAIPKLLEWLRRYLPAEIAGTITALGAAYAVKEMTGSYITAAIAGSIAESIGYYGVASLREIIRYWEHHHHHATPRRLLLTGVHTLRDMLIEFGPAEVIDSIFIRPFLFVLIPKLLAGHYLFALLVAKLLADVFFYGIAIIGYEAKKKLYPLHLEKPSIR